MTQHLTTGRRILREPETKAKTGLSRTTRWRLTKQGKFPATVQLTDHAVGNFEDEIDAWLASRQSSSTAA